MLEVCVAGCMLQPTYAGQKTTWGSHASSSITWFPELHSGSQAQQTAPSPAESSHLPSPQNIVTFWSLVLAFVHSQKLYWGDISTLVWKPNCNPGNKIPQYHLPPTRTYLQAYTDALGECALGEDSLHLGHHRATQHSALWANQVAVLFDARHHRKVLWEVTSDDAADSFLFQVLRTVQHWDKKWSILMKLVTPENILADSWAQLIAIRGSGKAPLW